MVGLIYPLELQLNKANAPDTETPFFGLTFTNFKRTLLMHYKTHFDFDSGTENFHFFDGDVPCSTSYGVYSVSSSRASGHVTDFNTRNKVLTA